jgi:hypothetical protein
MLMKASAPRVSRRVSPLIVSAALWCLAAGPARAEQAGVKMYECKEGGSVTYSDRPCVGQERELDIRYQKPDQAQEQRIEAQAQQQEAGADVAAEAALLDTEIGNLGQEIVRLQAERDDRLAQIQQQILRGTQSRDQTAWMAQQNAQIESITEEYDGRILDANTRLNDLRARRAGLAASPPGPGAH